MNVLKYKIQQYKKSDNWINIKYDVFLLISTLG